MLGIYLLLFLIITSGALGGFIYTLSSPHSHQFRTPFRAQDIESGFLGHMIIGVGGSFVALGAAIPVFDLNLQVFNSALGSKETVNGLIPTVLYVIAIGILGGFSGLRMISGLSDAMLEKLKDEIVQNRADAENQIKQVQERVDKNYEEDKKREKELRAATEQALLLEGNFLIYSGKPDQGVEKIQTYLQFRPNDAKALIWLAMGYKRLNQYELSVQYAKEAIAVVSDDWIYYYTQATSRCCLQSYHSVFSTRHTCEGMW